MAVSVEGVANKPKPNPNNKNPITHKVIYTGIGKNVIDIKNIPTVVDIVPISIGFLGPNSCKIFSPTRIIVNTAIKYVSDNKPVSNELKPIPCWTNVFVMRSVPATVLIKKLANVALV